MEVLTVGARLKFSWAELYTLEIYYVEALIPGVTVCRNRVFKLVIKVKPSHKDRSYSKRAGVHFEKRNRHQEKKIHVRHSEKVAINQVGRKASLKPNPVSSLILDFQLLEL
jgi:hypothetical protein